MKVATATEVKNPENDDWIDEAGTFWILRHVAPQNDILFSGRDVESDPTCFKLNHEQGCAGTMEGATQSEISCDAAHRNAVHRVCRAGMDGESFEADSAAGCVGICFLCARDVARAVRAVAGHVGAGPLRVSAAAGCAGGHF